MTLVIDSFAADLDCEAPTCTAPGTNEVELRDGTRRTVCATHTTLIAAMRPLLVSYPQYLQSDWWQTRRAIELERTGGKCERCGSTYKVEVHHHSYRNLGNEQDGDLEVLCHHCHSAHHGKRD